ncbi:coilin isoform X2 [Dunckerocampus dactyliophorus]|uniref:coilin isoform X2 n=1 Tax=Dunckerocampus dactyliophorus TaxID=161453 RepID=UPI002406CE44|nr:coilin isoform X2 [Dunckerocampus dactyliophorus]
MAAAVVPSGGNQIRVRLHFDYPPPAVADCRMCWLLLDLNTCRMVSDLESIVRDKFELSRRSIISLFIDNCYLPHTESIYVVRDNDSIRVKVDCWSKVNGHTSEPSVNFKKRQRPTEPSDGGGNDTSVERMQTKRKRQVEESVDSKQTSSAERTKKPKKKKQKAEGNGLMGKPASSPPTKSHKDCKMKGEAPHAIFHNPPASDCSCDVSKNNQSPKTKAKKPTKTSTAVPKVASRTPPAKNSFPSPPSSDTHVSNEDAAAVGLQSRTNNLTTVRPTLAPDHQSKSKLSNCAEEHRSVPTPPTGNTTQQQNSCDKKHGEKMEALPLQPTQQQSYCNGAESTPPDYSAMPLLAAPPQVGQKIAFKLLELTENYTPEVSDYKEGKIVSYDPTSKEIELELLSAAQAPSEPGKFDLVYQNPDGSELVEYAVSRESWVKERWDSLLEPRLFI